jgi:hypothetical protein
MHEHFWYWIAVAVSAALQIPFNFYVPLSNNAYRGVTLVAFGLLDFFDRLCPHCRPPVIVPLSR